MHRLPLCRLWRLALPRTCACRRGCGPPCPGASSRALRAPEGRTPGARRPFAPRVAASSRMRGRAGAGGRDPSRPSLRSSPRPALFLRFSAGGRCRTVQGEGWATNGADKSPKTCACREALGRRTFPSVPLDRLLRAARVVDASEGGRAGASAAAPASGLPVPASAQGAEGRAQARLAHPLVRGRAWGRPGASKRADGRYAPAARRPRLPPPASSFSCWRPLPAGANAAERKAAAHACALRALAKKSHGNGLPTCAVVRYHCRP